VKLLFDENLSHKLVAQLDDLFPGSRQVSGERLVRSADRAIWEHAKSGGFAIVTADRDYQVLASTQGPPPKVIWLRGCDCPTAVARDLLRREAIRVAEFFDNPERAVLILTPERLDRRALS
jgi:predicted nuclease of predicted toxin-antitoxin system